MSRDISYGTLHLVYHHFDDKTNKWEAYTEPYTIWGYCPCETPILTVGTKHAGPSNATERDEQAYWTLDDVLREARRVEDVRRALMEYTGS